jgi:hypothetical protein
VRHISIYGQRPIKPMGEFDRAMTEFRGWHRKLPAVKGAESKYRIAEIYFLQGKNEQAEQEVYDLVAMNTPHHYWMARSFILLADIYLNWEMIFRPDIPCRAFLIIMIFQVTALFPMQKAASGYRQTGIYQGMRRKMRTHGNKDQKSINWKQSITGKMKDYFNILINSGLICFLEHCSCLPLHDLFHRRELKRRFSCQGL